MKTNKPLPKWFDGTVYESGDIVQNPYSGETYLLDAEELSMYDYIIGSQTAINMAGGPFSPQSVPFQRGMRKGLDWFRVKNPEAYMVLLD